MIIQKDRLWDVLGNLGGLCIMGLIHFEGLLRSFITFSIRVCWVGKSSEYFLWTHEIQEYTIFDFESEMIMYGGKFVQA